MRVHCKELLDHPSGDRIHIHLQLELATLGMKFGSAMTRVQQTASFGSLQHKLRNGLSGHLLPLKRICLNYWRKTFEEISWMELLVANGNPCFYVCVKEKQEKELRGSRSQRAWKTRKDKLLLWIGLMVNPPTSFLFIFTMLRERSYLLWFE